MKKIVSLMSLILFLFAFSIQVFAASSNSSEDIISFEEFRYQLQSKFAQYDSVIEIEKTDPSFVYTRQILQEELIKADLYLSSLSKPIVSNINKTNNIISPFAYMPYSVTRVGQSYVVPPPQGGLFPAGGTVEVTAKVTIDAQYDRVLSVSNVRLRMISGTYLTDHAKYISHSISSIKNTSVKINITGEFKQQYSIPGGSSWALVKANFNCSL